MRRILLVLSAAMVMALMVVVMALPVWAAPPQEGEVVGGGQPHCEYDPATQTETCVGGSGGHLVGSKYGCGGGQNRVDTADQVTSVSGGGACGGADVENDSGGGRCVRNSEGNLECVGSEGFS